MGQLIVGAGAALGTVGGLALGFGTERSTQRSLDAQKEKISTESTAWLNDANAHFGTEKRTDVTRNRTTQAKLEDYIAEHPMPDSVGYYRDEATWSEGVRIPDRDGWGEAIGAGGVVAAFGGTVAAVGGKTTLGKAGGAALAAAGAAAIIGAVASNISH